MNDITIFNNPEFGEIRTVTVDDEPWFVASDIAKVLGYRMASDLARRIDEDDKGTHIMSTQGGEQAMLIINESGFYSAILGSKLESAKRFKHWVTAEVLPAIRKTGGYQKPLTQQEMMRIQLGMIDDVSDRVTKLENTMNIDYGQQKTLNDLVSAVVIEIVGGKKSNAYKEVSKKVFAEINRDYKDYFNVNSRANTPRLKFEEAVEYVKNWTPCVNTLMLIRNCNAQLNI